MKVKTILVSQPEPKTESSPYFDLADNQRIKVDFRPFIHVEGLEAAEVRKQRIDLGEFSAVILTSRNAVDHFFRIAEEMRYQVPDSLKYFCQSEAVAFYLQKYIVYRKRKVYVGKRLFSDLMKLMKKHKDETFLLPSSDVLKPDIPTQLDEAKIKWTRGILFKTVHSDLSDLDEVTYDILVFFSPSGIQSLFANFPEFKQNNTRIATFGSTTLKAASELGLKVEIKAPTPNTPSMTMALEDYIKSANK
ncbi:MAG: uroporphyrinogen-III synthase [Bacteroidota bacterium]